MGDLITSPAELANKIIDWKKLGYHVLSPAIQVSAFAPGYGVSVSLVLLDPNPDGPDCYHDRNTMDENERAPSKIGLMKICAAAGVSWVDPYGRVDPLTIQNFWIYRVTGVYLGYDGTPLAIKGEKEIDYRDGSAQIGEWSREEWTRVLAGATGKQGEKLSINGWTAQRVMSARMNGAERAETGALERAIRTLGIQHIFTTEELKAPFVTLRVCPVINMNDPELRRMVHERQIGGVSALYGIRGGAETRALTQGTEVINITPRRDAVAAEGPVPAEQTVMGAVPSVSVTSSPKEATSSPKEATKPDESKAQTLKDFAQQNTAAQEAAKVPEGYVLIANVVREVKPYGASHQKHGQTFIKFHVFVGKEEIGVTIYNKLGEKAERCLKDAVPVKITTALNSFREQDIKTIDEAPSAPATGEGLKI